MRVALEGNEWFTGALYRSLARLTRYTADRYGIPLDREHILGHDQVPGPTQAFQAGMHWDPGAFFDWERFMKLVGAPTSGAHGDRTGRIVEQGRPTSSTSTRRRAEVAAAGRPAPARSRHDVCAGLGATRP